MAFTPFPCRELLRVSTGIYRRDFFGETSQVLLSRAEKRDSGGWEGLFQFSTGLSKGHWDSPVQLSLLPSVCLCWCQQQSSLLPSPPALTSFPHLLPSPELLEQP